MIAVEQEDRNLGLREPAHLANEEETGLVVAPVAVIEIAGDDDEGDLIFDRLADEIVEAPRASRCECVRQRRPADRTVPSSGLSR